ncbi:MAG: hypothetical protein L3J74_04775 [Bacteroidales bacterium]|nr:hypothetical protein [Bacteroidales bacterium]
MKEIKLLEEQIKQIDDKDFDLEAWKILTVNILERIFGKHSYKIKQVEELKYDYSSWAMRDSSGSHDSIKKKAKVILESAILEIQQFGLPDKKEQPTNIIAEVLKDELKGSEYKRIMAILSEEKDEDEKSKLLFELLNDIDAETKNQIIFRLMQELKQ